MKKLISVLLVLALCLTFTTAALADFVPSITYKPMPELSGSEGDDGNSIVGYGSDGTFEIQMIDGELYAVGTIHAGSEEHDHACLVITPLSEVSTSTDIPEDAKELLLWIYDQIKTQGMDFFSDCEGLQDVITAALGEGASVQDLVVKDLFDVSVLCDPLEEYLEPEGTTICLDFDLDLAPGSFVTVLTYKGDQWRMIEDVTLEADGSVTCTTYENFCPVAILVSETERADGAVVEPVDTSDSSQIVLWSALAAASLLAILACVLGLRKRKKAAE